MTINIDTLYSPRTFSPGARDAAMGAPPNRGYLSTSNTIPQQSRNEAAAFQAENRQLRRQLEEMKAMASHVPRLFSSKSGKNAVRAARAAKYSAVDLLNLQEAKHFVQNSLFPCLKMWPKNWVRWHSDPKSICRRIMANVGVPTGMTEEDYWTLVIAPEVNDKLCALRSNFKDAMRKQCEGKLF